MYLLRSNIFAGTSRTTACSSMAVPVIFIVRRRQDEEERREEVMSLALHNSGARQCLVCWVSTVRIPHTLSAHKRFIYAFELTVGIPRTFASK